MASNAVSAVTYDDNNNKGQAVTINAGLVVAVTLPMIELMIDNTVTVWHKGDPVNVKSSSAWFH